MRPIVFALLVCFGVSVQAAERPPIVLVLTNHGQMGDTDTLTGFFLSEAAHPYEVFREAGYPVTVASPEGGFAPLDPKSLDLDDSANAAFWKAYGKQVEGRAGVPDTVSLATLKAQDVAGVFFAGGHGCMWDLPQSTVASDFITAVDVQKGVIGAVCHGPAVLVGVKGADGRPLVEGKKLAVFTNEEEEAVGLTDTVPFLLQDALTKEGGKVLPGAKFAEHAVRDGRLVTGQNPASATKAARLFIEGLDATATSR